MTDPVTFERHGDIAILSVDNPPVNSLGFAVRAGLLAGLERGEKEGAKAVLIYCIGRTWFAGADIREFGKPLQAPILPDLCERFEQSPLLVVSAMHGTALGGGLEIALSTDFRISDNNAQFGLPEVALGLIPGAGGTQRLPRLAGVEVAVEMITGGRPVNAAFAQKVGLIDELADGDVKKFGLNYTNKLLEQNASPRPVNELPAPAAVDFEALKIQVQQKSRGQLSPVVALDAIKAACELPFAEGMNEERRLFVELMESDQSEGLLHAFFSERPVAKLPEIKDVSPRDIKSIGVIGGGTMGSGIATSALLTGLPVTLVEMTQEAADKASERILGNLQGALKRGKLTQSMFENVSDNLLTICTDYDSLTNADIIIEAVFEEMDVKKAVFEKIDAVAKPGALLASNTSFLDINEIASSTNRAQDVLGLHFFSPAHVMKLLEVVVGDATQTEVTATGFALGKRLNKTAVRAGVCDGFIGNRILMAYRTAADHLLLDGASPFDIDRAIESFGFAMGPYAVGDLAGLDIEWAYKKRLAPTRHARERVPNYSDKLCEAGHFGQKTGCGHYLYEGRTRQPNPEVLELIQAERKALGIDPQTFSDNDIIARCMAAIVNEASGVLEEGIARRPLDIDTVLLLGYGFPRYRGGPMKWADMHGIPAVLADIQRFAQDDDYFWQPTKLLQTLAGKNDRFESLN